MLEVVELLEGELGAERERRGLARGDGRRCSGVLAATTIADVAEREAQDAGAPMYYI